MSTGFSRRFFLKGAAGAVVGLPLLEAFGQGAPKSGAAQCAVFVCTMCGVQQAGWKGEREGFWPTELGALSTIMPASADRATYELRDYADRLLLVRGLKYNFPPEYAHDGGGNQAYTAARVQEGGTGYNWAVALNESVDTYIGRSIKSEPMALYAGPKSGYINDHVFHRGPKDLRVGENNPALAYSKLVGLAQPSGNQEVQQKLLTRRLSVNDLIRAEMKELLARTDLSADDRHRLDMHFTSLREIETKIATQLGADRLAALKSVDGKHRSDEMRLEVERLQYDIAAFALAAGHTRLVGLQFGDGTDGMRHVVNGERYPGLHLVSHRSDSESATGNIVEHAARHHEVDRIQMRQFKYLLDRLNSYQTPQGSLLDVGFAVYTNQNGNGNHDYFNIPYVVAGKANGFFKTGRYISASGGIHNGYTNNQVNNKILNVFINAFGIRNATGGYVDDFGDPSLPKGVLPEMIA